MAKTEAVSNVDAAWLGMEDPTNLMMVTGIIAFAKPINFVHLTAVLKYRWLKFGRFRQRVVQSRLPLAPPVWEEDPYFDLSAHLHRVALPAPADKSALQEMVSDLLSTPLDFTKPLWQMHIVENYGEGSAIIIRIHHAIADGMALVYVLLSMTDLVADAPWPEPESSSEKSDGNRGVIHSLVRQATSAINTAYSLTNKLVEESREVLVNPARVLELAQQGADSAQAAAKLVLRSPDPQTLFKGALGVRKIGAWSRPLPLSDIKAIRSVTGGTVNDVLIAAMTGALRRYMQSRGDPVDGLNFRAAVPVNIRKPEEMTQMGNKFGLVFLSLPVGIADPLERLAEVRKRMDGLKNSPEALVAFGILQAMGMTPADMQGQLVKLFGAKATAVMTNVPGPAIPLYLAGQEIDNMMFWVPQSGRLGLGISILSYAGKVCLGVATDAGLVPDPDQIIDNFYEEYEGFMALVRRAQEIEAAPASASSDAEPERCQAQTKNGRRCRNRALYGGSYCHAHRPD